MANMNDLNCMVGSQIGGMPGNSIKETPLTRLSGALERLRNSAAQVSSVTGKLVGERPESCGEAGRSVGSGFFGSVEEMADAISRLASEISDDASRIADRL